MGGWLEHFVLPNSSTVGSVPSLLVDLCCPSLLLTIIFSFLPGPPINIDITISMGTPILLPVQRDLIGFISGIINLLISRARVIV